MAAVSSRSEVRSPTATGGGPIGVGDVWLGVGVSTVTLDAAGGALAVPFTTVTHPARRALTANADDNSATVDLGDLRVDVVTGCMPAPVSDGCDVSIVVPLPLDS